MVVWGGEGGLLLNKDRLGFAQRDKWRGKTQHQHGAELSVSVTGETAPR